jgi:hypothetical protein
MIPATNAIRVIKHSRFMLTSAVRQCSGGGRKQKAVDRSPPLIESLFSPLGVTHLAVKQGII